MKSGLSRILDCQFDYRRREETLVTEELGLPDRSGLRNLYRYMVEFVILVFFIFFNNYFLIFIHFFIVLEWWVPLGQGGGSILLLRLGTSEKKIGFLMIEI